MKNIFVAAIESAAIVESSRDKLIAIGLAMIPEDGQVALAVKAAQEAYPAQEDWMTARADIIKTMESTICFQVAHPLNWGG